MIGFQSLCASKHFGECFTRTKVISNEKENMDYKTNFPDSTYIGVGYESLENVLSVLMLFVVK